MIPLKPFYFIRHGETDWNRQNICMGSNNIPLNDLGVKQAELAAQKLESKFIEHIVTSPLSRARQTAEIIAQVIDKPLTIIDDLQEYNSGIAEGKLNEPREERIERWRAGNTHEGAEKINEFELKVENAVAEALQFQDPVLIVSHGLFYSALRGLLKLPVTSITNCAIFYHQPPIEGNDSWQVTALSNQVKGLYE